MSLKDYDLKCKKYDIDTLEKNIDNFSQWTLVKHQILTAYFCAKYILDEAYSSCDEDTYICMEDILCFQTHLTREEIASQYNRIHQNE
jgi:hypothetical protein